VNKRNEKTALKGGFFDLKSLEFYIIKIKQFEVFLQILSV